MRLESTFGVYEQAPGQANFVSFSHAYNSYFPSVQLKYDVTPAMDVRAVYSTAIGRPGFQQISPGASFNPAGSSVNIGNPNLSPEYADAFDLFWEYYLPRGGKISAGGFDKEFQHLHLPEYAERSLWQCGATRRRRSSARNSRIAARHHRSSHDLSELRLVARLRHRG